MPVRKLFLVSVIVLSALAYSSIAGIAAAQSTLEARQAIQSIAQLYMAAFNKHDPKAISMLFVPDGVFLPPNGAPIVQGRDAIERSWAGLFKNVGGHETITVKDAIPVGNDVVVAINEFKIAGGKSTISGRAAITLVKTPDGWRYVSITPQTQPPPSAPTMGSRQ
jgi:uncharacterized protein (TIGR02246 family)